MKMGTEIEVGLPKTGTLSWAFRGDNNEQRRENVMLASAISCKNHPKDDLRIWFSLRNLFSQVVLAMSDAGSKKRTSVREEKRSPSQKFWDYLDGYLFGFDLYPVCERQLFIKNDAYAILQDFWAVGSALNATTQELIKSPEAVLGEKTADDDIRRKKIEAAQNAIAAIRSASKQRDRGD